VHTVLAMLSKRMDSLAVATASLRALLSERLTEQAEAVATMTLLHSRAIEELRHANDGVLAELRGSIADSGDVTRRIAGRVDDSAAELKSAVATMTLLHSRAIEELSHAIDGVLAELRGSIADSGDARRGIAGLVDDSAAELKSAVALVRTAAAGVDALTTRDEQIVARVEDIGQQISFEVGAPVAEVVAEIALLREEVAQLKRRVGVRAKASLAVDDASLLTIAKHLEERFPRSLDDDELKRLASAIVQHLEALVEVVADSRGHAEPPPPVARRTSRLTSNAPTRRESR